AQADCRIGNPGDRRGLARTSSPALRSHGTAADRAGSQPGLAAAAGGTDRGYRRAVPGMGRPGRPYRDPAARGDGDAVGRRAVVGPKRIPGSGDAALARTVAGDRRAGAPLAASAGRHDGVRAAHIDQPDDRARTAGGPGTGSLVRTAGESGGAAAPAAGAGLSAERAAEPDRVLPRSRSA